METRMESITTLLSGSPLPFVGEAIKIGEDGNMKSGGGEGGVLDATVHKLATMVIPIPTEETMNRQDRTQNSVSHMKSGQERVHHRHVRYSLQQTGPRQYQNTATKFMMPTIAVWEDSCDHEVASNLSCESLPSEDTRAHLN
jgi:hypothetical protein